MSNVEITSIDALEKKYPGDYKKFGKLVGNSDLRRKLRVNSILTKEQWQAVDDAVIGVSRGVLNAVQDLRGAGLVRDLGSIGVLSDEWNTVNDVTDADVSMSGESRAEGDKLDTVPHSVPIPVVHKDFSYSARELEASRRTGMPLDTTTVESATRKVAEKLEDVLINGSISIAGDSIYGYLDYSDINSQSGSSWGTVANPWADTLNAIQKLEADNFFGPYMMYVNKNQFAQLREYDATTNHPREMLIDRIRGLDSIQDVKVSSQLANGTAVLVQLSREVVDLSVGMDIEAIDWESPSGMTAKFKILACMSPRVKSDYEGNCGVCEITGIS